MRDPVLQKGVLTIWSSTRWPQTVVIGGQDLGAHFAVFIMLLTAYAI